MLKLVADSMQRLHYDIVPDNNVWLLMEHDGFIFLNYSRRDWYKS